MQLAVGLDIQMNIYPFRKRGLTPNLFRTNIYMAPLYQYCMQWLCARREMRCVHYSNDKALALRTICFL